MSDKLSALERRIYSIEERNRKVALDKKWETSAARRILLTVFTYLSVGAYLSIIKIEKPWLNSIVPAVAFMLSTLTLPFFRQVWDKRNI